MHPEVISRKAKSLLVSLGQKKVIKDYYLAGGTALALQYGHRKSIDFDFFSSRTFSTKELKNKLSLIGKVKVIIEEEGTLTIELSGVKMSFFQYPYRLLFPFIWYEQAALADPRDIACMKLDAISSRGRKKDFIDFYFLLKKYSLIELLNLFARKYRGIEYNQLHLIKSLIYFKDADKEPMPLMIKKARWSVVKNKLRKKVRFCI